MTSPTKEDMDTIRALMRLELKRMRQEGWETALDRADDQRRAARDVQGLRYHDCPDCGDHLPSGEICACGSIWTDGLGVLGVGTASRTHEQQQAVDARRQAGAWGRPEDWKREGE